MKTKEKKTLKNFLPPKMKISLTQFLFIPLIDYGEVGYYDLNAGLLNKRDHLLNNCMQFIFNLLMYDHISALRSQLK